MSITALTGISILAAFAFTLLFMQGLLRSPKRFILAALLVVAAFAVRALCLTAVTSDYEVFLSRWVEFLRDHGGFAALSGPVDYYNYNFPYLYILAVIAHTTPFAELNDLLLIKLFSIFFDILLAFSAMKLVSVFYKNAPNRQLAAFFAVLFLPTVILNSAYWGQCDSIYTSFAVLSIYLALSGRPAAACAAIAVSFAFKLQAVFIMPVFIVLWFAKRVRLKHAIAFVLAYAALMLPVILLGRPVMEVLTIYLDTAETAGTGVNYNSPSVYAFVREVLNPELQISVGIIAAFMFMFFALYWAYEHRDRLNDRAILALAALLSVGIPFFLPHMHDRYFYSADILTLVFAFVTPAYVFVPVLNCCASLLGYHAYLRQKFFLTMDYGAALLLAVIGTLVFYTLTQSLESGNPPPGREDEPAPGEP